MESFLMIGIVVAGLALAAGLAWSLQPANQARLAFGRAEDRPIADLKHGEWAKVTGVVTAAGPTLTSPIGGYECIGFRLEVTRPDRQILSVVLRKEACQPFSISDETGKAHVEGPFFLGLDFADSFIVPQYRHGFLDEAGVPTFGILFDRHLAYR